MRRTQAQVERKHQEYVEKIAEFIDPLPSGDMDLIASAMFNSFLLIRLAHLEVSCETGALDEHAVFEARDELFEFIDLQKDLFNNDFIEMIQKMNKKGWPA